MSSWSYSGDKWLLFVREDSELIFTAVVTLDNNVLAERKVDEAALKRHSEELGLEMDGKQFKTLLLKALEQRQCVDVEVDKENENNETGLNSIFLSLTYKFSPTISRKGVFQLPIVATDVSQNIVTLLSSIHASPPCPMLSEEQQHVKREKELAAIATQRKKADSSDKTSEKSENSAEDATNALDVNPSTAPVNPTLLKRRHVPSGTMRRKGPRGAKLARK